MEEISGKKDVNLSSKKDAEQGTELETLDEKGKSTEERKELEREKEAKASLNCLCCSLKLNIFITYLYLFCSTTLTIIVRIIFVKYMFRFNFTFLWLQQTGVLIFCTFFFPKIDSFNKTAGEISFQDFNKFKLNYIVFAAIFIINTLSNFYGTQLVENTAMFYTFRKLGVVMLFLYDTLICKKKVQCTMVITIILVCSGNIISSYNCLTVEYIGYAAVLVNNSFSVAYSKFSETFRKRTGVSALKLMIYNSYLSQPFLISLILVTGEYKKLIAYFQEERPASFYIGLVTFIIIACLIVVILLGSCFLSNERNSGVFTQLLSGAKDVFITTFSYLILRNFKPTTSSVLGLSLSVCGGR